MKRVVWLLLITSLALASSSFSAKSAAPLTGAVFAVESNPASFDQTGSIRFENISTEEGLSQSTVTAILQDRLGFMWFGTEGGLNKYDGYQFSNYEHDPDNPQSLSSSVISSIYEDHDGTLWIGTITGLDRLDRKTGTFFHYQQAMAAPGSEWSVLVINQDHAGTLWLGTDGDGLISLDLNTDGFTAYKHSPDDPTTLSDNAVRSIYEDRDGVLWIGTDQGLDRFDPTTGTFIHDQNLAMLSSSISNPVYTINEDSQGNLWFGTQKGLFQWERARAHLNEFQHNPNIPGSVSDSSIRSIFKDSLGILWIGTRSGLDRFVESQKTFVHYNHNPNDPQSLISDSVRTVYEDRSGVMWIGTSGGGLSKYARASQKFNLYKTNPGVSNSLSDNNIWSVYEDHAGNLWIGTFSAGVNKLDRTSGVVTVHKNIPGDSTSISNDEIRAILEDHYGNLWIGTEHGGLNRFDPQAGIYSHYQHNADDPNSLGSDSVFSIYEDGMGRLWVGTYGGGLNLLDGTSGTFTHYLYDEKDPFSLSDNNIKTIFEDSTGILWVGTLGGVNLFDERTRHFTAYHNDPDNPASLSSDLIFCIAEDSEGRIWIGTLGGGLNRFDRATRSFTRYTEKNGLPDSTVYGILAGADGSLWLSTNKGISKFDPHQETFRNYDVSAGLQGNQFNPGAFFQSRDGEMFFGGTHGLNAFFSEQVTDNPAPPSLIITTFKKFNQISQTDLIPNQPIRLSYRDSFISFEFAALDFNAPDKNQYAYKLDGFDKDWVQAGNQRYATYTNLPGGNYILRVKASNNDGIWNEQGLSIPIIITPPFWQTWWFIGSFVVMLGVAVLSGFKLRLNSIREQNVYLETQVAERTSELQETNKLLESEVDQRKRAEAELEKHAADKLKQSEARFQAIFDNVAVGVAVMTLERRAIAINAMTEGIIGYSLDELRGVDPRTLVIPEDRNMDTEWFKELVEGKRDSYVMERRYRHKDGHIFWARINYSLVRDLDGSPDYLIGIIEDIDDRKRASERLAEQEAAYLRTLQQRVFERTQELEDANQLLQKEIQRRIKIEKELAEKAAAEAVIADRTRLARDLHDAVTQTLFSASLTAEVLPDLWEMDVDEAKKSTEELRQLTRGALAEMRTLLLELRPVALTQTRLSDLIKQLSEAFIGRSRLPITLNIDGDHELPPEVQIAVYRIAQESLNNVFKYARATQVNVSLFFLPDGLRFEVCDDGIGFDMSAIKPASLGMRIMRERAEAIGANFHINSTPGSGTCVEVIWNSNPNQKLRVL